MVLTIETRKFLLHSVLYVLLCPGTIFKKAARLPLFSAENQILDGMTRKKIWDRESRKLFTGYRDIAIFSGEIKIHHPHGGPLINMETVGITTLLHDIKNTYNSHGFNVAFDQ